MQDRPTGAAHYKRFKLKPIVTYVMVKTHGALMRAARKRKLSLQAYVQSILERQTK